MVPNMYEYRALSRVVGIFCEIYIVKKMDFNRCIVVVSGRR